ncbi:MAG: hypothetical protein NC830_01265 [Candidatus Omnitrophica bacterium]|nr:hypothetical protein [Candidatus Omnitrophota bacterium]
MRRIVPVTLLIVFACSGYCQEIEVPMQRMQPQQQIQKNIENDTLVRMLNELEITDEQMPVFIKKFREMVDLIRQQKEHRDRIAEQLRKMISSRDSGEKLEEKIVEFEKFSDRAHDDFRKFCDDMKKILKPEQQVKFLLMADDIRNILSGSQGMPAMRFQMIQTPIEKFQPQPPEPAMQKKLKDR